MNDAQRELVAVACIMLAVFCAGGLSGLWLAWTQPTRMAWWASRAADAQQFILSMEEKGSATCPTCGAFHSGVSALSSSPTSSTGSASGTVTRTSAW